MATTAAQLAADIVSKARKVETDRYGDVRIANLFIRWILENMSVENDDDLSGQVRERRNPGPMPYVWMSDAQATFLAKLMDGKQVDGFTPDHYEHAFYFAVKTVNTQFGVKKVLYFGGEPECVQAPASKPSTVAAVEASGSSDKANATAARMIRWAVDAGRAEKDKYASEDDDYLVAWLSPSMAVDLVKKLPPASVREDGTFLTQAAGPFCYWGKRKTASGALLLCWMGEPPAASKPAPAPQKATPLASGKRIPADSAIPF